MNTERDKFLTKAMGECFHQYIGWHCRYCGQDAPEPPESEQNPDFSTWTSFGKLWEWAIDQEWWNKFEFSEYAGHNRNDEFGATLKDILQGLINPDRFATAVYEFLKEK